MIQQQEQFHHAHTLSEKAIWWCVHQFGALTILACILTGAIVLLIIIFRRIIKEKFGAFLAWADKFVNKE